MYAIRSYYGFKIAFRRLMMPFLFVSIAALTVALELSFNTAGSPFIKVVFSKESFAFAIQLFLKSMSVISVVSLGIAMISISEMTAFLRFFRVPELLIELLVMVHHSIQIIGHKTTKLYTAQKSRMAYNGQFKNGLTCFSLLVTSIFSSSLNQIQQQAIALDARCYNNKLVWVLPRKNIKSIQLVWLTIGRITSYNVCYTKLLRSSGSASCRPDRRNPSAGSANLSRTNTVASIASRTRSGERRRRSSAVAGPGSCSTAASCAY